MALANQENGGIHFCNDCRLAICTAVDGDREIQLKPLGGDSSRTSVIIGAANTLADCPGRALTNGSNSEKIVTSATAFKRLLELLGAPQHALVMILDVNRQLQALTTLESENS